MSPEERRNLQESIEGTRKAFADLRRTWRETPREARWLILSFLGLIVLAFWVAFDEPPELDPECRRIAHLIAWAGQHDGMNYNRTFGRAYHACMNPR